MINRHYVKFLSGLCLSLTLWGVSVQTEQKVLTAAITIANPVVASTARLPETVKTAAMKIANPVVASTAKLPETVSTVNSVLGFPDNVPKPLKVGVALLVSNISKIDESASTFTADIDLRLRWRDPAAFGAKTIGVDRKHFMGEEATTKLKTLWTPQIKTTNLAETPLRQENELVLYDDGEVLYSRRLTATFEYKMELASFPFDIQTLPIRLTSSSYSANKVIFEQDQSDIDFSGLKHGLQLSGWTLRKNIEFVPSRFRGLDGDYYPQLEAQIIVGRNSLSHIPGFFIPYSLVLLLPTIVSLWINALRLEKRVNAWAGSILTLLALSFTLAIRYPRLGADNIFHQVIWAGFGFQFLMLVITATVLNPDVQHIFGDKYVMAEVTNFLRWSIPAGLVIFLGYMALSSMLSAGV
jgi:hypothetical protein